MTEATPAPEERLYPADLLERLGDTISLTGHMTSEKRARKVLDGLMDYSEEVAGKVQGLADALGLGEPTEARQSIPVTCEVTIPLGSVTDMVRVLSDIPVTARITLRTAVVDYRGPAGVRILSEEELERTRPRLVAIWDEVR